MSILSLNWLKKQPMPAPVQVSSDLPKTRSDIKIDQSVELMLKAHEKYTKTLHEFVDDVQSFNGRR